MFGVNHFKLLDWIVVGVTLGGSLLIGVYYAFTSKNSNEDLLVGGRNMRILPVAASVMVTYVSAVTILGFPAEVYAYGAQIFMIHVVSAFSFIASAFFLIPYFYQMRLTSINEYLERRFESVWVRWLASATFILQQTTLIGVILYAPSIALEAFLGLPVWISILGIGVCGTIYTSIGGLKAVVWTDAFQFFMMLAGMIAIVAKGFVSSGGVAKSFEVAWNDGRLTFIDLTFDPFMRHNLWNFMLGSGFYALMQPAVHQIQVQRYSSMPNVASAKKAIIYSVPLKILIMGMCLVTGVSIYATYSKCDPKTNGDIRKFDQIVPYFVVHELIDIPGMVGLFTSCVFSAVLSSLSSALNSLSAVTWEDFLSRMHFFKTMSPGSQTNISRLIALFYGVITMGIAFGAQNIGAIYSASFATVGATGGALFGVFLLGMFVPFANAFGAIVGMLTSLAAMGFVSVAAFIRKKDLVPLPMSIEECPVDFLSLNNTLITNSTLFVTTTVSSNIFIQAGDDWPYKILNLSYLLYAIVGAMITIIVGSLFSLIVIPFCKSYRKRPKRKYIHPLFQFLCGCCTAKDDFGKETVIESTGSIIRIDPIHIRTLNELDYHEYKKYEKDHNKNSVQGNRNPSFEMSDM